MGNNVTHIDHAKNRNTPRARPTHETILAGIKKHQRKIEIQLMNSDHIVEGVISQFDPYTITISQIVNGKEKRRTFFKHAIESFSAEG